MFYCIFNRFLFTLLFLLFFSIIFIILLYPLYISNSITFPYSIAPFDIAKLYPSIWKKIKFIYILFFVFSNIIISNYFYSKLIKFFHFSSQKQKRNLPNEETFNLSIGYTNTNNLIKIPLKSLYQNILITGTIGTGKTSSAMYPFTEQLIGYKCKSEKDKIGMLILDVKGNYHKKVYEFSEKSNRTSDIIEISLNSGICYNPLDKPLLKPAVLSNRLKTILTLFSKNTTESYWLDKSEQIICECIKFCRLYNNNYVTFEEIHKLVIDKDYFFQKLKIIKELFFIGKLNKYQEYDLLSSLNFFENEFFNLDQRTSSILKSEITRITNPFVSDYQISKVFCPHKDNLNFFGFSDVINKGKIVVLNMNIAEYKNLSKIIAAYLKLDFQTDLISRISNQQLDSSRTIAFLSDEFHEYVTSTDAEFFALSRESKCINIIATQSYTSIVNALESQNAAKVIIQNIVNKIWFRTDDAFTIEDIQKQIGKEDKKKFSKSISENSKESHYNYFTKKFNALNSNLSETLNTYTQTDFIYDTNFFTQQLETFSCLAFLSNGTSILKPQKLTLIPYFNNYKN